MAKKQVGSGILTDEEMEKEAQALKKEYLDKFPEIFKADTTLYDKFHHFFSPHNLPRGLDEKAIRKCLIFYDIARMIAEEITIHVIMKKLPVKSFMTKKDFFKFITAFATELAKL